MLPFEQLKAHQVQVDGVGVLGGVDEFPNFHGAEDGLLSHWLPPVSAVESSITMALVFGSMYSSSVSVRVLTAADRGILSMRRSVVGSLKKVLRRRGC